MQHGGVNLFSQPCAIHQDQPLYTLGMLPGKGQRNRAAERVPDDTDVLPAWAECVEKTRYKSSQYACAIVTCWLIALTCPYQVEGADAKTCGKGWQVQSPGCERATQPMHKQHTRRLIGACDQAMCADTAHVHHQILRLL